MEVKALETLIGLLQGDEDGDDLPEQVSIERSSWCEMQFRPIVLDLFVITKAIKFTKERQRLRVIIVK